MILSTELILL